MRTRGRKTEIERETEINRETQRQTQKLSAEQLMLLKCGIGEDS